MIPSTRHILVTGGLGFLGQHLLKELIAHNPSCDITVIDLAKRDFFVRELAVKPLRVIDGVDITRSGTMDAYFEGKDVVFHLAGVVSFWRGDRKALFEANIRGTENVLAACRKGGIKKLIYVSSTAATGYNNDRNNPADETYRFDWKKARGCFYMLSKHYAEEKVERAAEEGLPVVIANPAGMYGPGDRKIFVLVESLLRGKVPAMMPAGFSMVDVRDVARGLVLMMGKGRCGEKYLLTGGNYTYREMLGVFSRVLDVRAPSKVLPFWTGSLLVPLVSLAEMFSSVQPKLTREMLLPSFKYRYFTSVKAERELGWKPAISMEQTFRDVYAYYRDCREKGEPG